MPSVNYPSDACWDNYGNPAKCGDVNGDGFADTNDLNPLFYGAITTCNWAADVNCDGFADTNDLNPLFYGRLNCCEPGCPA